MGRYLKPAERLGHPGLERHQRPSPSSSPPGTVRVAAVVDIIPQMGICPRDEAVVPITENRFTILRTLFVV